MSGRAWLAALALLAHGSAAAKTWQGDAGAGPLQFVAVQADAKFTGSFKVYEVRFDFDPATPAAGHLDVTVALASTDTADVERDEILKSAEFFWTERHPQAKFHATRFRRAGKRWRADGELTLRGVTKPAAVLFTLVEQPQNLGMKGEATIRRLPFGVGQGEWQSTEWVGDEVVVRFDLKLKPASEKGDANLF